MYMTTLSLAAARADLSKLIDSAERTHERFEVTRNGQRVAVILGADDYDSLIETLDIMSDKQLMVDLRRAQKDIEDGRGSSAEDVKEEMRRLGRLSS